MHRVYSFLVDDEESSTEIAIPLTIKAKSPFLRIQKKMGTKMNHESVITKCIAITVREKPQPQTRDPVREREGKSIESSSPTLEVTPPNPKAMKIHEIVINPLCHQRKKK